MTAIWNRTDDFESTPPYGDELRAYYAARPHDATLFDYSFGRLCDFEDDQRPTVNGLEVAKPNAPCMFAWRGQDIQDVQVRFTSSLRTTFPAFGAPQVREAACVARLRGGFPTGTGDAAFINQVSCYVFSLRGNVSTGQVTFELQRWNGGARTSLGVVGPLTVADSVFDGSKPFTLRLDVIDIATFPFISCFVENFETSAGPIPGSLFQVFNAVQDSDGGRLSGSGRCGFVAGQDGVLAIPLVGDVEIAQKVHRFRIVDYPGAVVGDTLHDDNWERTSASLGTTYTDDFGNTGPCLQSSFYGDVFGQDYFEAAPATPDTIRFQRPAGDLIVMATSQRPVDDEFRQFPQVDLRWTGGTGSSEFGVCAKASGAEGSSFTGMVGYFATLDASANLVRLYRANGGGTPSTLATAAATINLSTWYEIGLQVRPVESLIPTGTQLLEVYLDGAKVSLVSSFSSVFVPDGTGGILDTSSARIASGPGEGLMCWATSNDEVEFRNWSEGTFTESGPIPPQDMASVVLADEGLAEATLGPNLALVAQPIRSEQGWQVARNEFDSGHTLARTVHRSKRRTWPQLQSVPMTRAQYEQFRQFWRDRRGPTDLFNWESPEDNQTYKVRFLGELDADELFRDVWVVRFGLEEAL